MTAMDTCWGHMWLISLMNAQRRQNDLLVLRASASSKQQKSFRDRKTTNLFTPNCLQYIKSEMRPTTPQPMTSSFWMTSLARNESQSSPGLIEIYPINSINCTKNCSHKSIIICFKIEVWLTQINNWANAFQW